MSRREGDGPAVPGSGFGAAALIATGVSDGNEKLRDSRDSFSTSREIVLLDAGIPTWAPSAVGLSPADMIRTRMESVSPSAHSREINRKEGKSKVQP